MDEPILSDEHQFALYQLRSRLIGLRDPRMAPLTRASHACTEERCHGRYEKRECWVEVDWSSFGNKRQRAVLDPNFRAEVISNFHA